MRIRTLTAEEIENESRNGLDGDGSQSFEEAEDLDEEGPKRPVFEVSATPSEPKRRGRPPGAGGPKRPAYAEGGTDDDDVHAIGEEPNNDGEFFVAMSRPYIARVTLVGTAAFLYHRWSTEAIEEKARAPKGSNAKKTDNLESYVYRHHNGNLAIPGEYVRMSIINAAKYNQDPRSPRKSAMDLFKAGVVALTEMCDTGYKEWSYTDARRAMVQRQGITRRRPALDPWQINVEILCNLPEYISPELLHQVLANAGKLQGIGDFRPTYGRFRVTSFSVSDED